MATDAKRPLGGVCTLALDVAVCRADVGGVAEGLDRVGHGEGDVEQGLGGYEEWLR